MISGDSSCSDSGLGQLEVRAGGGARAGLCRGTRVQDQVVTKLTIIQQYHLYHPPPPVCRRATTRTAPRPAARTAACWTPRCHTHPAPPTPATSATPTPASGYSRTQPSGQQKKRKAKRDLGLCLIMGIFFCGISAVIRAGI